MHLGDAADGVVLISMNSRLCSWGYGLTLENLKRAIALGI